MSDTMLDERIRAAIEANPNGMTMQLARDLGVPEVEVIRALPDGRSVELDMARWEELIGSFAGLGKLHVIVSNGGATLEAVGEFGNFSTWGEFFNVQTPSLDMHIRWPHLGAAFAVEKPGHTNGVNTYSFQFYDKAGNAAFKAFMGMGSQAPGPDRQAEFARIRQAFRREA